MSYTAAKAARKRKSLEIFERHRLDCERVTDIEILQLVSRSPGGRARPIDLLLHIYPGQKFGFSDNQIISAQWAFVRLLQKDLLYTIAIDEKVVMKVGPPQPGFAFFLSEAGRFNLMTHNAGVTARSILEQIEGEK